MKQVLQVYTTSRGIKSSRGSQGISRNRGIWGRKERKRMKGMGGAGDTVSADRKALVKDACTLAPAPCSCLPALMTHLCLCF